MSRNSKNAKRIQAAKALPKNRSAAAKAKRAEGKPATTGRTSTPAHGKKNAWWQKFPSYGAFIRGGKKGNRNEEVAV